MTCSIPITLVRLSGDFRLNLTELPGVPKFVAKGVIPQIEKFIVSLVKPNLERTNESIGRFLSESTI